MCLLSTKVSSIYYIHSWQIDVQYFLRSDKFPAPNSEHCGIDRTLCHQSQMHETAFCQNSEGDSESKMCTLWTERFRHVLHSSGNRGTATGNVIRRPNLGPLSCLRLSISHYSLADRIGERACGMKRRINQNDSPSADINSSDGETDQAIELTIGVTVSVFYTLQSLATRMYEEWRDGDSDLWKTK